MTQHQYNFTCKGSASPAHRKLWLEYFHDGKFAAVRPSAWRVYCFLLFISDYLTYQCEISHEEIATNCGMVRQTVPELTRELAGNKLITYTNNIGRGGQTKNKYFLSVPSSMPNTASYSGEIISDQEVDVTVTSVNSAPQHVELKYELYKNGFFSDLGKDHAIWKLYCSLLFRADFKDGFCNPAQKQIEIDSGMGERTIRTATKKLVDFGLIRTEKYKTSKGNIAYKYYVWPLDNISYANTGKKPTPTPAKNRQPDRHGSDSYNGKKQTPQSVGNLPRNLYSQHSNTTSLKEKEGEGTFNNEKIEDLLTEFYSVNPDRESLPPDQGINWLTARVKQYGFSLVKYVVSSAKYKDKFTTKLLDGCMQTQDWINRRNTDQQQNSTPEIIEHSPKPEMSVTEKIAQKRKLLITYQTEAELNPDGLYPKHVNRLRKELAELEQQGS